MIRRLTGPTGTGFQRLSWDFRYPAPNPVTSLAAPAAGDEDDDGPGFGPRGPMVPPGSYTVSLTIREGAREETVGTQRFSVVPLGSAPAAGDRAAIAEFNRQTARLQRAALGTSSTLSEAENRLNLLRRAIENTPGAPATLSGRARALVERLRDLRVELSGDDVLSSRQEPVPPTLLNRVQRVVGNTWSTTQAPTATHRRNYEIASQQLAEFLPRLNAALGEIRQLEIDAERAGTPWTPGRVPEWRP